MLCLLASEPELRARMAPPAQWLTPAEAARLASLGSVARQQSFLAGRWLAREAVQRQTGSAAWPVLDIAASGACVVRDVPGVHVSISHSGGQVACAAADLPVGIDLEDPGRPRGDVLGLARIVDGEAQRMVLARLPEDQRSLAFLQGWTMKEAWLKARGRGLDFGLMRTLAFEPSARGDVAVAHQGGLLIAVAADPLLPAAIQGPDGLDDRDWRRHQAVVRPDSA